VLSEAMIYTQGQLVTLTGRPSEEGRSSRRTCKLGTVVELGPRSEYVITAPELNTEVHSPTPPKLTVWTNVYILFTKRISQA
jgi:hypothetical protein